MSADARPHSSTPHVAPVEMSDYIAHLVRRVQQLHVSRWAAEVSTEVTSAQFAVLNSLAQAPGIDQITLTSLASLDRSTVADMTARMERRGLIDRTSAPDDLRRRVLHLTPLGADTLAQLIPRARAMSTRMFDGLTDPERHELRRLLVEVLRANGRWTDDQPVGEPAAT